MKPLLLLSETDHALLTALLYHRIPGLVPHPAPHQALSGLLKAASITTDSAELEDRVSLSDQVVLVSPADPRDSYEPAVVLPEEADVPSDRLSVISPIGLAVIGRKTGDTVTWQIPSGQRDMTIAAVRKAVTAPS